MGAGDWVAIAQLTAQAVDAHKNLHNTMTSNLEI